MIYYKFSRLESIYYFCEIDYVFKTEQWKDVLGYEGVYQISDLGRCKGLNRLNSLGKNYKGVILKTSEARGYVRYRLYKNGIQKTFGVHVLVAMGFLGHIPCGRILVINHKNFVRHDNRISNLEIVTFRENVNKKHIKSSSQYTGVMWDKSRNKWQARIHSKGKTVHLGRYINEIDAHYAYENKLKELTNE